MIRFGLIGCGRIGRMHAHTIAANTDSIVSAVSDVVPASAREVADVTGASIYESAAELFTSDSVDAVLVASATATHADYIEAAVASGKPVLCEKPIDLDIARVRSCRAAIAGSAVPVQIGFNRRFDPGHSALKDALDSGEIGDLVQVLVTSRDPAPPSLDYLTVAGGMIRDMTIHDFDLARFLLGTDEPSEVFAVAGAVLDPTLGDVNDVDCAMILMKTASGKQVLINNARQAPYGYDQRLEALGSKGMLQSCNRKPHELRRFGADATEVSAPYLNFFVERYREAFERQLASFIETVRGNRPPAVSFDDGLAALRLAEAAYLSLKSGRSVSISEI